MPACCGDFMQRIGPAFGKNYVVGIIGLAFSSHLLKAKTCIFATWEIAGPINALAGITSNPLLHFKACVKSID